MGLPIPIEITLAKLNSSPLSAGFFVLREKQAASGIYHQHQNVYQFIYQYSLTGNFQMVNLPQANARPAQQRKPRRSLTTCAINDYPAFRWEVSPGHTCGARESQVNKIALPLLATGDPIAPKGYQRAELRRRTRC